jgi:hypothetical protein
LLGRRERIDRYLEPVKLKLGVIVCEAGRFLKHISDTLWGFKSGQKQQFAPWNRFRAVVALP